MRLIFGLIFSFAIGLAFVAALFARDQKGRYEAELAQQRITALQAVPTTMVYVTTRPIRYGERVTKYDVRAIAWPLESVPEGVFLAETADLFPAGGPDFRSALRAIEKDEPLLKVKLTDPGLDAGVSARLAPGQRAFAIQVDVQTGVAGLLRPGDRVDVYWTGPSDRNLVTRLLEGSLHVVAVDQSADMDSARTSVPRTITVQATPQQVASLTQAQATGRLSLSLLGGEDDGIREVAEVGFQPEPDLTEASNAETEPEATRRCTVTMRKAGEKSAETTVTCRN